MTINIGALKVLLAERFENNQTKMAKAFGLRKEQVNIALNNNGKGAGANFCGAVMKFCEDNNMDYKNYIILP